MRWYVLFVLGGKETEVREILNEEYAQAHAFIPMIEIVHRKKGESHLVQKPMFLLMYLWKAQMDRPIFPRRSERSACGAPVSSES